MSSIRMSIVRSNESLAVIERGRKGGGGLKPISLHIRVGQKEMLEELARLTGESQAAVLRAIIDEWCESKLNQEDR